MSVKEPFAITYDIGTDEIEMTGDLEDTPEIRQRITKELQKVTSKKLTILADMCRVFRGGEQVWIDVVHTYLMNCELTYGNESHLAVLVKYSSAGVGETDPWLYRHPKSSFPGLDQ